MRRGVSNFRFAPSIGRVCDGSMRFPAMAVVLSGSRFRTLPSSAGDAIVSKLAARPKNALSVAINDCADAPSATTKVSAHAAARERARVLR